MKPREKKHRLELESYRGQISVSFTACIKNRERAFSDQLRVAQHVDYLERSIKANDCSVMLYCFMPDHLHAVVTGNSDQSDLKRAFESYKQVSGFNLRKEGFAWQKDYYDHVVRESEDMTAIVNYIAENPVRAELVESPLDYHGLGAIGFDVVEVLQG